MLSIQFFEGQTTGPREAMNGQVSELKKRCSHVQSSVLAEDATSITYEWMASGVLRRATAARTGANDARK